MYATGIGLLLKGYEQFDEMTDVERKKFFATQPEEVTATVTETVQDTVIETNTHKVYNQEVVEDFEEEHLPKPKKSNLLQQVILFSKKLV